MVSVDRVVLITFIRAIVLLVSPVKLISQFAAAPYFHLKSVIQPQQDSTLANSCLMSFIIQYYVL